MAYVDGFVLPVPKDKVEAYREIATMAGKVWKEYGALDYHECVADDARATLTTLDRAREHSRRAL